MRSGGGGGGGGHMQTLLIPRVVLQVKFTAAKAEMPRDPYQGMYQTEHMQILSAFLLQNHKAHKSEGASFSSG